MEKNVRQFRHWLTFCINCARTVPDALDPKAACILENVRDKFDELFAVPVAGDAGEALARQFHEIYERRAPEFGYETRTETREFDPTTPNGRLMIAVCGEIAATPANTSAPESGVGAPLCHLPAHGRFYTVANERRDYTPRPSEAGQGEGVSPTKRMGEGS